MIMAEFITLTCRDGDVFKWTSYDANITVGPDTWLTFPFSVELPRVVAGTESTQCRVTIAPGLSTISGTAFQVAAGRGKFDSADFSLSYAFMSGVLTPVGLANVFTGHVERVKPGSTEVIMDVESLFTDLSNQRFPKRNIQISCPYVLYGTQCGVNSASFSQAVTATFYDSGTLRIDTNVTASRGGSGGYAVATNGLNNGVIRSIKLTGSNADWVTVSGTKTWGNKLYPAQTVSSSLVAPFFVITNPFPEPVVSGSTFILYDGCDRSGYECSASFNNITRFGGFPEVPQAAEE
jgi:hypothetical protein